MAKTYNYTVNGKEYYRVRAKIEVNGKTITKAFLGDGKKDAEKKRDEYIAGLSQNASFNSADLFDNLFKEWFDTVHRPAIAESTYFNYSNYYNKHIKGSDLAKMRLCDVKTIHIQKLYNSLPSKSPLHFVDLLLKIFLKYLYDNDVLQKDLLRGIKLPKFDKIKTFDNFLMTDELAKLKVLGYDPDYFPFLFLVYTGLRRGELAALMWSDVDLKNKLITINKNYSMVALNTYVLSPTKGREIRKVPIPDTLIPYIEKHRGNVRMLSDEPFIKDKLGLYRPPHRFYNAWMFLRKKVTDRKVSVHGLRHTYCTLLCTRGVPMKTASELMGHKNTKMVDEIYSHVQIEDKYKAVNLL